MSARSKAALVVDDNGLVRWALKAFLESNANLVVSEAADGAEAIVMAKQLKPDLIIMDLAMPNVNGLEAAALIHSFMPDAQIVVFSLYCGAFGEAFLHAAGVDVVVEKVEGATGLMRALPSFFPNDGHGGAN